MGRNAGGGGRGSARGKSGISFAKDGTLQFNQNSQIRAKLQYYYGDKNKLSDLAKNVATAKLSNGIRTGMPSRSRNKHETSEEFHGLPNNSDVSNIVRKIRRGSREMDSRYNGRDFITGQSIKPGDRIHYDGTSGRTVLKRTLDTIEGAMKD